MIKGELKIKVTSIDDLLSLVQLLEEHDVVIDVKFVEKKYGKRHVERRQEIVDDMFVFYCARFVDKEVSVPEFIRVFRRFRKGISFSEKTLTRYVVLMCLTNDLQLVKKMDVNCLKNFIVKRGVKCKEV
jgi:hypothetical protein